MGSVLVPGTTHVELALHVATVVGCDTVQELVMEEPVVLAGHERVALQVAVGAPDASGRRALTIHTGRRAPHAEESSREAQSPDERVWTRHVSGVLAASGVGGRDRRQALERRDGGGDRRRVAAGWGGPPPGRRAARPDGRAGFRLRAGLQERHGALAPGGGAVRGGAPARGAPRAGAHLRPAPGAAGLRAAGGRAVRAAAAADGDPVLVERGELPTPAARVRCVSASRPRRAGGCR